ncbi:hypothetical protein OROGR_024430 [Orobanche gracilis]
MHSCSLRRRESMINGSRCCFCLYGRSKVLGIIPKPLAESKITGATIGDEFRAVNMQERITHMTNNADAFITLTGGFGTLEELFHVVTRAQLNVHKKPIGLLNVNGFFDGLLSFIDFSSEKGFISERAKQIIVVATTLEDLIKKLIAFVPEPDPALANIVWKEDFTVRKRKTDAFLVGISVQGMSDNGSVPSPPLKDSDHLFGPSEIGSKFAYEAGIRRKIISNNDMFPEWAGYIRRLRACELEEGGSLCNHILEMMNYMNKLEYLDTNFDRNLAVPLLLRSLPDSYNDLLRYEEDKITQKEKLEEEKGKEKRKEKHYALDAQVGSSKRRKSCSWRDLGNGERKCPKNIEESMGSSS